MEKGKIAGNAPIKVSIEEGKKYAWCTCGLSETQPLCDGAHRGTDFTPKKFVAEETKDVWLCTCKQTDNPGFCDGAHKKL